MTRMPGGTARAARAEREATTLEDLLTPPARPWLRCSRTRFNPLAATGTPAAEARRLTDRLAADAQKAVQRADLVDRALVDVLLGKELRAAVAVRSRRRRCRSSAGAAARWLPSPR